MKINLKDVLISLLNRWWIILLTAVICAGAGFGYANYKYVPKYSVTVKMYVNNDSINLGSTKVSVTASDIMAAQELVHTYCEILTTYETYETTLSVIKNNGGKLTRDYSYGEFLGMIQCDSLNNTEIFYIKVTCPGQKSDLDLPGNQIPDGLHDARLFADAIMTSLTDRIQKVITSSTASKVEGVNERFEMSSSNDVRTGLIGAVLGAFASAVICAFFDVCINDKIKSETWLTDFAGEEYTLLSVIPNGYRSGGKKYSKNGKYAHYYRYESDDSPESSNELEKIDEVGASVKNINYAATEAYNLLRTNVYYSLPQKTGGKILGITSASPSDGKTFTSVHLAYAMAKEGAKVLLVECDMRRPMIAKSLNMNAPKGLSDLLIGKEADVIYSGVVHENLSVLFAGVIPPNPSELLSSPKMQDFLDDMAQKYEYILLDLPPVLAVADPLIVAKYTDAMMLVIRHGITRKKYVLNAVSQLRMTKAKIAGFVYNDFHLGGGHYYKKDRYYYRYQKETDMEDQINSSEGEAK